MPSLRRHYFRNRMASSTDDTARAYDLFSRSRAIISLFGRETSLLGHAAFPASGLGNCRNCMTQVAETARNFRASRALLQGWKVKIPCHQGISPQSAAPTLTRRLGIPPPDAVARDGGRRQTAFP